MPNNNEKPTRSLGSVEDFKPIHEQRYAFRDERQPTQIHYDIDLDDAGLTPYEFRAYQRIARRCAGASTGNCFESLQNMADACRMSRAMLALAMRVLIERRMVARFSTSGQTSTYVLLDKAQWLSLEEWRAGKDAEEVPPKKATRLSQSRWGVHLVDRGCLPGRRGVSTTEMGGVHLVDTKKTKKKTIKANKKEDTLSADAGARAGNPLFSKKSSKPKPEIKPPSNASHPMVVLYRDVTEFHKLTRVQCDAIALEVEDEKTWLFVLKQRTRHGWKAHNVAGALKDYHQLRRGVNPADVYPNLESKEHSNGKDWQRDRAAGAPRRESRAERNERLARKNLKVMLGGELGEFFDDSAPGGIEPGEADAGGPIIDIESPRRLSAGGH